MVATSKTKKSMVSYLFFDQINLPIQPLVYCFQVYCLIENTKHLINSWTTAMDVSAPSPSSIFNVTQWRHVRILPLKLLHNLIQSNVDGDKNHFGMRSDGRRNILGLSEAIRAKAYKSTTSPAPSSNSPNQTLITGPATEKSGVRASA